MHSLEKRWVIIHLQACLLVRQVPHGVDSIPCTTPCTISGTICADSCTVYPKQIETDILIQVSFLHDIESYNFGLILQAERFFFPHKHNVLLGHLLWKQGWGTILAL